MKVFSEAPEILYFGKGRTTPQLPNEKLNSNPGYYLVKLRRAGE